jgi:hypothetical protein
MRRVVDLREQITEGLKKQSKREDIYKIDEIGLGYQYIELDSFEKSRESRPDVGEFLWNVSVCGLTTAQLIGVRDRIENIRAVATFPFELPDMPLYEYVLNTDGAVISLPALIANAAAPVDPPEAGDFLLRRKLSQFVAGARLVMEIKELGLQSVSDREGKHHSFEYSLKSNISTGRIVAKPIEPSYRLSLPISQISHFHVVLKNYEVPLHFSQDCLNDCDVSWELDNPADPYFHLTFMYSTYHMLLADDRVLIQNFVCDNEVINTYVNSSEGLMIGVLPVGGDVRKFRFNPDVCLIRTHLKNPLVISAGEGIISTTQLDVYIFKYRLKILLRFLCQTAEKIKKTYIK